MTNWYNHGSTMTMSHDTTHTLLHKALEVIRMASSGHPFPSQAALARAMGESEANISRWLSGASTPTLKKLEPILIRLGVRFSLPSEETPPPLVIHMPAPSVSDDAPPAYIAVQLLGETGTPFPPSQDAPEWLLIRACDASPHTVALRVGAQDRSMLPTLHPGDVVLIDRCGAAEPTSKDICLVQEPPAEGATGGWLLRRVSLKQQRRETLLVFTADNMAEDFPPAVYALSQYPDKTIAAAIQGKVTHIWVDLRARLMASAT